MNSKCKLEYIIPLHRPQAQNIDIGIVSTKEFGYRGIIVKDGDVHILPAENIISSFNNKDNSANLIARLGKLPNSWDLVYDEKRQLIIVWAKLRAAGKLGQIAIIGVVGSSSSTHSQVDHAFNKLMNYIYQGLKQPI